MENKYGIPLSNDELYAMAVIDAFEYAYDDEFRSLYTAGDRRTVEAGYECNSPVHLYVTLTIGTYECRIAYSTNDMNSEEEADVIRLNKDPEKSADRIYETIKSYIRLNKRNLKNKSESE